ncbi:MAG: ornithine cyclodeaminase family protein [Acidobacteria bacterium]|nr:ornithine cyclodeaminase family protein [Acidobacteriota bacterium]
MEECIAVMEDALRSLGRGEVHNPLRQIVRAPDASGMLGLMPAYRGGERPLYGLKEVCVFPGNPARGLDTHLGAVLLHDGETGELLAIANASAITAIRTAAVSAVATKLLARPEAKTLAILGAGVQARTHLEAMRLVRPIEDVRVFSRTLAKAEKLGRVASSAEEAIRGADIIVTATSSKEPVLERVWIADGAHINAVGSSVKSARELDGETVRSASLFVDRRESTMNESGDYLMAGSGAEIRGELGELLLGTVQGRRSETEITLFKSLGLAIEDLASASFLYDKARRTGEGTGVDF